MTKIQGIQPDYQIASKLSNSQPKFAHQQSFGNSSNTTDELVKEVVKTIDKKMGWVGKLSAFLSETKGEAQTQLINAVFTSTLAPFFIAFNPFSKQDEKTKEYTALRQPISAGIAITGGLAMTSAVDKFMSIIGSEGHLKGIDGRFSPDKDYLKDKFNKAYKAAPNKSVFLASCEPEKYSRDGKSEREYKKDCREGYIKKQQEIRKNLFTKLISEKPENIQVDEKTKIISIVDAKTKRVINANIAQDIPHLTTQKELDAYLKDNSLYNQTFGAFMKEHFGMEAHKDGSIKAFSFEKKIGIINAKEFLEKMGLFKDADVEEIHKATSMVRQVKTEDSIKKSFNPKALNRGGESELASGLGKQMTRMIQGVVGEAEANEANMTLNQLLERLDMLKEGKDARHSSIQHLLDQPMSKVLDDFTQKFVKAKVEGFKDSKGIAEFARNIIEHKAAKFGKDFPNYKGFTGIFFNLFMTMVTCTALNWSYPRIVEALFPSLVKDDAKKGGNK